MSQFREVFKRTEIKYLLSAEQYEALRQRLQGLAEVDQYGECDILNIYYDTPGFQLIRTSLEKPVYKEKLRLRSYGTPRDETQSFIEIKKKYNGVVYKRRIDAPYRRAKDYLEGKCDLLRQSQIKSEIGGSPWRELRIRISGSPLTAGSAGGQTGWIFGKVQWEKTFCRADRGSWK